jgi:hypothetical protein
MKIEHLIEACRNPEMMVSLGTYPEPGRYVVTGIQAGNFQGEKGWENYIGYVVQVRKKAGAFDSDMILLRHPDGSLSRHENQFFYYLSPLFEGEAKKLFDEDITPEKEDYTEPYTLGEGKYPEIGKVIEPKEDGPPKDNSPMMKITVKHPDGRV